MGCNGSKEVVENSPHKKSAPVDTNPKKENFTNSFSQSVDYSGPTPSITTAASSDSMPPFHSTNGEYSGMACFGAGCYWGTEKFFKQLADKKIAGN